MGVQKDIEKAKYLVKTMDFYRNDTEIFDMIYPFTNENISAMFTNFNLKDKKCLSVLGSSDQVFDMYLRGAKEVTTFDINPLSKYLFYLKKAALASGISKEEFLSYFCYKNFSQYGYNEEAFNEKTFNKIVPYLYGDSYKFWSSLYDEFKGIEIREDRFLFSFDECLSSTLEHAVSYLKGKNYDKASEMASSIDIKFINEDIRNLKLNEIYDFMYFSNIIQYASSLFYNDTIFETKEEENRVKLQLFKNLIMSFKENLSNRGIIILGYIYTIFDECERIPIFNKKIRDEVFSSSIFDYKYFKSILCFEKILKNEKDACLIYRK